MCTYIELSSMFIVSPTVTWNPNKGVLCPVPLEFITSHNMMSGGRPGPARNESAQWHTGIDKMETRLFQGAVCYWGTTSHDLLNGHMARMARLKMSSRRTRDAEQEINDLIAKLQSLLPETRRRGAGRASAAKLLKETCSYIRSLNREVDDLSGRLSELMETMDSNSVEAEIIRGLLHS
ncbi:hypothetical protein ZIOFF_057975 [Zingiber officinale]|uniref:BHLH domain-containing protein n=2 Tax=Zingiber officinale TaxID=94328 RepID=A0A8J5F5R7_ZINOF|nr:hypothetical protein ZIOFF_057975 [Zingiber officinale]